jgi:phosphoglycolate phosphatase-like HAD superfamily hydrolase
MVGDTLTDMRFAKNAGLFAIGLGKSKEAEGRLAPLADKCIYKISELCDEVLAL